jgi:hypothetical protein
MDMQQKMLLVCTKNLALQEHVFRLEKFVKNSQPDLLQPDPSIMWWPAADLVGAVVIVVIISLCCIFAPSYGSTRIINYHQYFTGSNNDISRNTASSVDSITQLNSPPVDVFLEMVQRMLLDQLFRV